jgi:tetratricopeptide (TPR) repeat protein
VFLLRGAFWAERRRWDAAVADLEKAIQLRPDAAEGYVTQAQVHRQRHDYEPAAAALGDPLAQVGFALVRRKHTEAAVSTLDRALERSPNDPGLYHTRAQLQALRGDRKAAREDFERAVKAGRDELRHPGAQDSHGITVRRLASDYVELGHLMHLDKEYRPALASYDAALQLLPDYPPAHRQRAETLLALDDYVRAGQALDRYLRHGQRTAEVYQARGLIHEKLREYAEAVEAYNRALQFGPVASTLGHRGWVYLKLDSPRPALADFEAALRLDPASTFALCGRAFVRVRRDEVAGAVEDAAAALRHDPHNRQLIFRVAGIYAQAVGRLDAQWGARAWTAGPATQYQARAVELLAEVLRGVPEKERKAFWRDNIQEDNDLAPIRRSESFLNLARSVER